MKRCIGSAKHHRIVFRYFERYYDAKEVIHKRISWNPENFSKSGPKVRPKIKKIESSIKRCIGSAKYHRTVFPYFERYYDAKEVIHKRISWIPENISQSGPKVRPKILKNWILMKKVHRIRKTSQKRFSLFSKDITMLKKWFISAFPEIQKIYQNLGPNLGQKLKKLNLQWKGASDPHNITRPCFAFSKDITMLKKWFISAFPEIQKISQNLGPNLGRKLKKLNFNEKVHRIRKISQHRISLIRKILWC